MSGLGEYLAGENDGPGGRTLTPTIRNLETGREYPLKMGNVIVLQPKVVDPLPFKLVPVVGEEGEFYVEGEIAEADRVWDVSGRIEINKRPWDEPDALRILRVKRSGEVQISRNNAPDPFNDHIPPK